MTGEPKPVMPVLRDGEAGLDTTAPTEAGSLGEEAPRKETDGIVDVPDAEQQKQEAPQQGFSAYVVSICSTT